MYQKKLEEKVKFFKELPLFRTWTKESLVKVSYFFKEQKFWRNHIVFKQGEDWEYIYIVLKGEFESTKMVKLKTHKEKELKFIEDCIGNEWSKNFHILHERFKDIQMYVFDIILM